MKKLLLSTTLYFTCIFQLISQNIVTVNPQYKSTILEEFTGIHCGYCPDGHVIASGMYDANPDRVILINIHQGSFASPGTGEPDFRTSWGDAIANQTGITGYPAGTVNRHVFSTAQTPGGTANGRSTWTTMSNQIMQEVSPVNVGASSSYNSSTNELTIDVEAYYTSNSALSTNYINVVLLQDSLLGPQSGGANFNPNNYVGPDYVHSHMLRDMITGQWGDVISTTTQGSLFQNQYIYTLPSDVNGVPIDVNNCHLAVFISESYQEIYTGISIPAIGGYDNGDHAKFLGDFTGLSSEAVEGSNGNTSTFSFEINPLIAGSNDYIFELTSDHPNDWTSNYSVNGNTYNTSQTISLTNGATSSISIDVNPGITPSISSYTLTMTMASDSNAVQTQKVYVISGITDLIVNGSGNNGASTGNGAIDFQGEFIDGLTYANNTSFDATSAEVMNLLSNNLALTGVNNIYYNIGWTFPSLADDEANALMSFMDNGGNLFIAGQDIGWDIESGSGYGTATTQNFYSNYINASYVDDGSTSNSQYSTVTTDPIYGSVGGSSIVDAYGGYMYPDQFDPINGATAIYNYNNDVSKVGAIRFENNNYKMVYIGVSLEMIADNSIKDEIVKVAHDWFYGNISSIEVNFNELFYIYPNPATDQLFVTSNEDFKEYSIYTILGENVISGNLNQNAGLSCLNIENLPAGNYTIVLRNNKKSKSKKFIVSK